MSLKYLILSLSYIWISFLPVQPARVTAKVIYNHSQQMDIFQVTPNPGGSLYTVIYKSERAGPLTLIVSDATGKYVYLKSIRDFSGELKESIDLSGNPKGLYVFEIEGTYFRELKKVVLQ